MTGSIAISRLFSGGIGWCPLSQQCSFSPRMVHFSDLRGMMYDPVVRELVTAHDLARQNTPLAAPDMTLQQLLDVFHETDVGSLAVVDDAETRHVVGIVEQRDLLLVLHKSQTS